MNSEIFQTNLYLDTCAEMKSHATDINGDFSMELLDYGIFSSAAGSIEHGLCAI